MARFSARLVTAFAELRRRRVFRLAAGYAVAVWLVLQVADVVFPALGLTDLHLRVLVVAAILLFPLVLFLGWRYDLTADGLVRTRPAAGGELSLRGSDYLVLVALAGVFLAAAYAVLDRVLPGTSDDSGMVPQGPAVVAVMPLANVSDNPDNEYLADGLSEELINVLARLNDIKVIGRISSFAYKNSDASVAEIGQALKATHLLSGSVRQSGQRLRITAQLIQVGGGSTLWSESYDEAVGDVFEIQSSIASAVADRLQLTLLENQPLQVLQARNFQAFDRYLAGRSNMRLRTLEGANKGITLFREAIALDDEFAPAYAALALGILRLHVNYRTLEFAEAFDQAESAIQTALGLDPQSYEAHAALAVLKQWRWQLAGRRPLDRDAADEAYRKALALNANDAEINRFYANFLANTDHYVGAIEYARNALQIDPIAPNGNAFLGSLLQYTGEFDEARRRFQQEIEVTPTGVRGQLALASLVANVDGDLAQAVRLVRSAESTGGPAGSSLARLWLDLGGIEEATGVFEQVRDVSSDARWVEGFFRQDYEGAYQILATRLESRANPVRNDYRFAGRAAVLAGRHQRGVDLLVQSDPRLAGEPVYVGYSSVEDALCLAFGLKQLGETDRMAAVLAGLRTHFARSPRNGTQGYGWADAQALVLEGKLEDALDAFKTAIDQGRRSTWYNERWPRPEVDPLFEPLWGHPRFQELVGEMNADLARQLAGLRE
ncbi:MAG: hypothetical protein QNJ40_21865 [Xanthomonadales bacterium]|nr:hypothetical protein [Xanthomonadales bacterium]